MIRNRFIPNPSGIWAYLKDPKANWKPKALVVVAIAYLFWPLDALPDLAPILGWLDDIGFAGIATWYLGHATNKYLAAQTKDSPELPRE